MYGKKAVYFNYKTYGAFIGLLLIPALLVLAGASIAYMFLSVYPILFGVVSAIVIAFPGLPRLLAINANADLKLDKNKKALKKIRASVKLPFVPVGVHIFHAYIELIHNNLLIADRILSKVKQDKLTYSEQAKFDAVRALILWIESDSPEESLKYLKDKDRNGADEAILYTVGKLLNLTSETAKARSYNFTAFKANQINREILSNLVVSYYRTTQYSDAKIMFRTLYYDMKATSDSLYYMAKIKEKENKKQDAVSFIEAALKCEKSALNTIGIEQLNEFLAELKREEL